MVLGSLTKNDSVFFYFRSLWISRIEEVKRKLEDEEKREEDSVSSGGIGGYGVDTDADNAMQVKSKIELLSEEQHDNRRSRKRLDESNDRAMTPRTRIKFKVIVKGIIS